MAEGDNGGRSWTGLAAVMGAIAALITAGVGVYAAVGGGGGDEDGSNSPIDGGSPKTQSQEPTLEEWRQAAAHACSEFRDQTSGLDMNPSDLQSAGATFRTAAPLARNFSKQLGEIPAPTANQQDIQQLTAGIDLEAGKFEELSEAAGSNDVARFQQAFTEWRALNNQEQALFVKLGASGCAT